MSKIYCLCLNILGFVIYSYNKTKEDSSKCEKGFYIYIDEWFDNVKVYYDIKHGNVQ